MRAWTITNLSDGLLVVDSMGLAFDFPDETKVYWDVPDADARQVVKRGLVEVEGVDTAEELQALPDPRSPRLELWGELFLHGDGRVMIDLEGRGIAMELALALPAGFRSFHGGSEGTLRVFLDAYEPHLFEGVFQPQFDSAGYEEPSELWYGGHHVEDWLSGEISRRGGRRLDTTLMFSFEG